MLTEEEMHRQFEATKNKKVILAPTGKPPIIPIITTGTVQRGNLKTNLVKG